MSKTAHITAALVLAGTGLIFEQRVDVSRSDSPEVVLKTAVNLELVDGQPSAAIQRYREIATRYKTTSRRVAAQALLHAARSYERIASAEAKVVYSELLRDFADQPEAAEARARLGASKSRGGALGAQDVTPRRVLDVGTANNILGMSADGRWAVGSDFANGAQSIALFDVPSGQATILVAGSSSGFAGQPRISNDGSRVAYRWTDTPTGKTSLRVVGTGSGATPEVFTAPAATQWIPRAWSPDDKSLLVVVVHDGDLATGRVASRELAWLSLERRSAHSIKVLNDGQTTSDQETIGIRVSPDGRFIAFTAPPQPGSTDRYIYVMDANGRHERAIVTAAGSRSVPIWTPDGTHLLFAEDSGGRSALYAVGVSEGRAVGEPFVVQSGFRDSPVGMTTSGTFYFARRTGGGNYSFVAPRNPAPADRALTFAGHNASWSRDGRLAFLRPTASQGNDVDLIIRDVATGEERSIRRTGLSWAQPRWLNDSSGVIVLVKEQDTPSSDEAFYRVDARSGSFQRLFAKNANGRIRSWVGAVSPDDRTLYLTARERAGTPTTGIVAVDMASGTESPVVTFAGGVGLPQSDAPGLAVSPDGATLAVMAQADAPGRARILTVSADGANVRELLTSFPVTTVPNKMKWSPDGRTIVFIAVDAHLNFRIMRLPADGGQAEFDGLDFNTLGRLSGFRMRSSTFSGFDLSPDGSRVIVSTGTVATTELWSLDNLLPVVSSR